MPRTITYNTIEPPKAKELETIDIAKNAMIWHLNNESKKLNNNGYSYSGADMEHYISRIELDFEDSSGNIINRNFKELSEEEIKIMLNKEDFRDKILNLIYQCNEDCTKGKSGLYISKDAANFMKKVSEQISNINTTDNPNDAIVNIRPTGDIDIYNSEISIIKSFCEHYSKAENIITQTAQQEFSKNFNDWEKGKEKPNKVINRENNNIFGVANLFAMIISLVPMTKKYLEDKGKKEDAEKLVNVVLKDLAKINNAKLEMLKSQGAIFLSPSPDAINVNPIKDAINDIIKAGINNENINDLYKKVSELYQRCNNTELIKELNESLAVLKDKLAVLTDRLPDKINYTGIITTTGITVSCAISDYLMRKELCKKRQKDIDIFTKALRISPSSKYITDYIEKVANTNMFDDSDNITLSEQTKIAIKTAVEQGFRGIAGIIPGMCFYGAKNCYDNITGRFTTPLENSQYELTDTYKDGNTPRTSANVLAEEEKLLNHTKYDNKNILTSINEQEYKTEWSEFMTGMTLIAAVGLTNIGDIGFTGKTKEIANKVMMGCLSLFPSWANQNIKMQDEGQKLESMMESVNLLLNNIKGNLKLTKADYKELTENYPQYEKTFDFLKQKEIITIDNNIDSKNSNKALKVADFISSLGLVINEGLSIASNGFNKKIGLAGSLVQLGGSYAAQITKPTLNAIQNGYQKGDLLNLAMGAIGNTFGLTAVIGINFVKFVQDNQTLFFRFLGSAGMLSTNIISLLSSKDSSVNNKQLDNILNTIYDDCFFDKPADNDMKKAERILALQGTIYTIINDPDLYNMLTKDKTEEFDGFDIKKARENSIIYKAISAIENNEKITDLNIHKISQIYKDNLREAKKAFTLEIIIGHKTRIVGH